MPIYRITLSGILKPILAGTALTKEGTLKNGKVIYSILQATTNSSLRVWKEASNPTKKEDRVDFTDTEKEDLERAEREAIPFFQSVQGIEISEANIDARRACILIKNDFTKNFRKLVNIVAKNEVKGISVVKIKLTDNFQENLPVLKVFYVFPS